METIRRLSAILIADVAGYSRLMGQDEGETVRRLSESRQVFAEQIARAHGRIVNAPGDSILAEFSSVVDAVGCAVAIQRELAEKNAELPDDHRMRFRIGLNLGDVIVQGEEIYGDGVNIAARLQALAEPGGICISGSVSDSVQGRLELDFQFLGEQAVKNIKQPVRAYHVLFEPGAGAPTQPVDPVLAMPTGPTIAVLAFANLTGDPGQEYFSDGITEEIITELTRFKDLHVLSRTSTFQYKGRGVDVRQIGRDLGAAYILEGSVRKSGDRIRISAQLLDARDGKHLWAETYERQLTAGDIFSIQTEITERVVAAIGGGFGAVFRAGWEAARTKRTAALGAYDAVLRARHLLIDLLPDEHFSAREALEKAVEDDPFYADGWAWLSMIYRYEYMAGLNPRPDPLERALQAARRSIDLDPSLQFPRMSLAWILYLRRDPSFFDRAEEAIAMNPSEPMILAGLGIPVAQAGRWERGVALLRKAIALDARIPGWAHVALHWDHYRKGEYREALDCALKAEMPSRSNHWAALAVDYAQLGRIAEAGKAIAELLKVDPNFGAHAWAEERKWFWEEELVQHIIEGLRKAGLEVPDE